MPHSHSILIIEDSRELVELLYRRFESLYSLSFALDGKEGLALARLQKPDLVVLDINLPGLGGYEVLKEIRASDTIKNIAVIMITAMADTDSVVMGLELGADDFIAKPFNFVELSARIKAHLTIKDLQKQLMDVERLRTLHEVAVSFHHEINNPLMSISAFAYFLKNNLKDKDGTLMQSADGIIKDVERISGIVKNLSVATHAASVDYIPGLKMIDFENLKEKGSSNE